MAMRIAVLFDAENIDCPTAEGVLSHLATRGTVVLQRAVGDFSTDTLHGWLACARIHGIDLVLQPGLGKGKNAADIRLTIEAMDLAHTGRVDAVALVSHDGDFTPLALRLRDSGMIVLGFGRVEPSADFKAACNEFRVIGKPVSKPVAAAKPVSVPKPGAVPALAGADVAKLKQLVAAACAGGPIAGGALGLSIRKAEPGLVVRLGKGKFIKSLVAHGLVTRVGKDANLVAAGPVRQAS